MIKLIGKSAIFGFVLGALLFGIAPLGLGIYFIEYLKPVLVPGVLLTQSILGTTDGSSSFALALFLNGAIYTIPIFLYLLSTESNAARVDDETVTTKR